MQYREFMSLTDEEITFIINDLFHPLSFKILSRFPEYEQIHCSMTTTWKVSENETIDIEDDMYLTETEIDLPYDVSDLEYKYRQFLFAK